MPKLDEATLRRVKGNLRAVVSEQQRKLGVPDPGGREVDEFIEPTLCKLALEDQASPPSPVAPLADPAAGYRPSPLEQAEHEGMTVFREYAGTYDWDLKTGRMAVRDEAMPPESRLRAIVQKLMQLPEWAAQFKGLSNLCGKHALRPALHCVACERRAAKLQDLLLRAYRKFGDPRKPREAKVIVG